MYTGAASLLVGLRRIAAGLGMVAFLKKYSADAACSASSLSITSISCGNSSMLELNVPGFVAKSPPLVKAGISMLRAPINPPPVLSRRFTLRGTRQAPTQSDGGHSSFKPAANIGCPFRSSLLVFIRNKEGGAEGYSPRLRMLDIKGFTARDKPSPSSSILANLPSPAPHLGVDWTMTTLSRAAGTYDALTINTTKECGIILAANGCGQHDVCLVGNNIGVEKGDSARKNIILSAPFSHESATPSRHLCGRLWKGTTMPPITVSHTVRGKGGEPSTRPSRTLFLVSGQGHQQPDTNYQRQIETNTKTTINSKSHNDSRAKQPCVRPSSSRRGRRLRWYGKGRCRDISQSGLAVAISPRTLIKSKLKARGGGETSTSGGSSLEVTRASVFGACEGRAARGEDGREGVKWDESADMRGGLEDGWKCAAGCGEKYKGGCIKGREGGNRAYRKRDIREEERKRDDGDREGAGQGGRETQGGLGLERVRCEAVRRNTEIQRGERDGEEGEGGKESWAVKGKRNSGSVSGSDDEEFCYDAATMESTAGLGDIRGRRLLHIRVPRPPLTALLTLRSVPSRNGRA